MIVANTSVELVSFMNGVTQTMPIPHPKKDTAQECLKKVPRIS